VVGLPVTANGKQRSSIRGEVPSSAVTNVVANSRWRCKRQRRAEAIYSCTGSFTFDKAWAAVGKAIVDYRTPQIGETMRQVLRTK